MLTTTELQLGSSMETLFRVGGLGVRSCGFTENARAFCLYAIIASDGHLIP
jgi:hypothetical protein